MVIPKEFLISCWQQDLVCLLCGFQFSNVEMTWRKTLWNVQNPFHFFSSSFIEVIIHFYGYGIDLLIYLSKQSFTIPSHPPRGWEQTILPVGWRVTEEKAWQSKFNDKKIGKTRDCGPWLSTTEFSLLMLRRASRGMTYLQLSYIKY